jgi:hypothetical protein
VGWGRVGDTHGCKALDLQGRVNAVIWRTPLQLIDCVAIATARIALLAGNTDIIGKSSGSFGDEYCFDVKFEPSAKIPWKMENWVLKLLETTPDLVLQPYEEQHNLRERCTTLELKSPTKGFVEAAEVHLSLKIEKFVHTQWILLRTRRVWQKKCIPLHCLVPHLLLQTKTIWIVL